MLTCNDVFSYHFSLFNEKLGSQVKSSQGSQVKWKQINVLLITWSYSLAFNNRKIVAQLACLCHIRDWFNYSRILSIACTRMELRKTNPRWIIDDLHQITQCNSSEALPVCLFFLVFFFGSHLCGMKLSNSTKKQTLACHDWMEYVIIHMIYIMYQYFHIHSRSLRIHLTIILMEFEICDKRSVGTS